MAKPEIIKFSDLVEDNGKTIRENNLERAHKLPVGMEIFSKHMDKSGRVEKQIRDCDGSPLYSVSFNYNLSEEDLLSLMDYLNGKKHG